MLDAEPMGVQGSRPAAAWARAHGSGGTCARRLLAMARACHGSPPRGEVSDYRARAACSVLRADAADHSSPGRGATDASVGTSLDPVPTAPRRQQRPTATAARSRAGVGVCGAPRTSLPCRARSARSQACATSPLADAVRASAQLGRADVRLRSLRGWRHQRAPRGIRAPLRARRRRVQRHRLLDGAMAHVVALHACVKAGVQLPRTCELVAAGAHPRIALSAILPVLHVQVAIHWCGADGKPMRAPERGL